MYQKEIYFLHSTSTLSFHVDVVLTLSCEYMFSNGDWSKRIQLMVRRTYIITIGCKLGKHLYIKQRNYGTVNFGHWARKRLQLWLFWFCSFIPIGMIHDLSIADSLSARFSPAHEALDLLRFHSTSFIQISSNERHEHVTMFKQCYGH